MTVSERLFSLQDKEYAAFQTRLTPGVPKENFIGVRVPDIRRLGKTLIREGTHEDFLAELPHRYYDENMLHGVLLSEEKNYESCVEKTEAFLPYVDNWAVCDTLCPKIFAKNKDRLLIRIRQWSASEHTYTCRFGMEMLMRFYLDEDFKAEYLEIPAGVRSEEYYVKMMVAWFFATALAKQWDAALPYIKQNRLDLRTHNKTVQKARESFRITDEKKKYLNTLKR